MRHTNEFQTIDDILAEMEAANYQAYLIDGLIDSAVTTIQGDSYLGKTYLALDAANSLITGEPFLGKSVNRQIDRVAFMVTDPGGVYELARRVKSAALDRRRIVAMSLYAPDSWDEWKAMLIRLKALGSDVVVIVDNTTDLAIDANSPREVKLITDGLRMWTEDGVAIINIHHMNKGGVYGGKSGFGSIIWQKWARAELTLRGHAKKATRQLEAVSNNAPAEYFELAFDPSSRPAFTVLSSGQAITRERERDRQRLDRNLEIAEWIVANCQGNANVSDVARRVTNQFRGTDDGHRRAINGGRYPVKRDGSRWSLTVG